MPRFDRLSASGVIHSIAKRSKRRNSENTNFPTDTATSWAVDHVAISGLFGCDSTKNYSLCGDVGGEFMKSEWGYPDIGLYICNCPSAGHDMIALDYKKCGNNGEPEVVLVDQESDYNITFLADNFDIFLRGLVHDSVFDTSDEDLRSALELIGTGRFSTTLQDLIEKQREHDFDLVIRSVCRDIALKKGHFSLHADELSSLMYDIQFLLMSSGTKIHSKDEYVKRYPDMIVFGDGDFTTGGYAPDFITDWLKERISKKQIVKTSKSGTLCFSGAYTKKLLGIIKGRIERVWCYPWKRPPP